MAPLNPIDKINVDNVGFGASTIKRKMSLMLCLDTKNTTQKILFLLKIPAPVTTNMAGKRPNSSNVEMQS